MNNDIFNIPGHISLLEGRWLQSYAAQKLAVEVGSYRGRSSAFIASTATHVWCCDSFTGQPVLYPGANVVDFFEVRADWEVNLSRLDLLDKVTLLEMRSSRALDVLMQDHAEQIGMAFIDGSHYHGDLVHDVQYFNLLELGGCICFHDYNDGKFPDVRRVVDTWVNLCGEALSEVLTPDTMIAYRKMRDFTVQSHWDNGLF